MRLKKHEMIGTRVRLYPGQLSIAVTVNKFAQAVL